MKIMRKTAVILVVAAIFSANINAQVQNDVITAYNEGAKAMQTDINLAIASFEKVVTLANQVGESANDLKQKAIQVLPGLYFKVANNALKEKKPAADIIKASKTAMAVAEKYENASFKENSKKVLVQGYYAMGNDLFARKDYANAVLALDSLLSINPDFSAAIFNKALIYKSQNNAAAFEENIDLTISKMKGVNDTVKAKQASTMALEYFRGEASKANQAEKLDDALALLNKASKYGTDKDVYYYYADVYNKQKNFDSGLENAQKGLALETGAAEAKAKFYYQLAVAQAGKGQNADACASFKNALYGPFAAAAKAQRTNLKCQ